MSQEAVVRQRAPKGETQAQGRTRVRETQIWEWSIEAIGPVRQKQTCEQMGDMPVSSAWHTIVGCSWMRNQNQRTQKDSASKPWLATNALVRGSPPTLHERGHGEHNRRQGLDHSRVKTEPLDGGNAVEWIVLTTASVVSQEDAWEKDTIGIKLGRRGK